MSLLRNLLLLTVLLGTSGCAALIGGLSSITPEPKVVVETEYVERAIPIQPRPSPVDMPGVEWYVVTEENIDEFLARVEEDAGDVVFMAITPKGYENLALGIGDLRRYMLEQKEIIAYYESQAKPKDNSNSE